MLRFVFALAFIATGCAPSLAPTYRDYRISPEAQPTATASAQTEALPLASGDAALEEELVAALREAGWAVVPPDAGNVISTDVRRIETGVFSTVEASLDLAPLNGRFVRVYVHAVRRNVFGSRSKLPYLTRGLRNRALDDVTAALANRGLVALDAPRERDEEATD
ncbi:hypothetical protein [Rubricoccus marinus]|uniref:DUF4136 domain-containing protein n=1 Tax=Rubricoccus marinus TaxID=716817 RepID=A0A259TXN3_9BACT|nr:hypothetical protein [Rubricoccus marinus]OZC02509.1 hypothetical protein BSZ36_05680 [Rubricoccus marinus]